MPEVPVNYVAVLIAAVASMIVGMLWYGPLFGKQWKAMMGFTDESIKTMSMTPTTAMIFGFIAQLVMAYVLSHILVFATSYMGTTGMNAGFSTGFWIWLGFAAPLSVGAVLWEGRPWKLWFLNGAYWLVTLLVMGGILASM